MSLAAGGPAEWDRVMRRLRVELGEEVFTSWFARLDLESHIEGVVHLSVPTRFLKTWLQSRYRDKLVGLCRDELGTVNQIEFTVRGATRPRVIAAAEEARAVIAANAAADMRPIQVPAQAEGMGRFVRSERAASSRDAAADAPLAGSPLDARYSFETFLESKSNSIAVAAARRVADSVAGEQIGFNPLFLHAQVGLGKTHLLQALAKAARANGRRVVYLTAEHFMYRFITALKTQSALAFKEELRGIDLLLIDDLQFLQGKQVQQEFCHTLNSLIDGSRQVVVAADRPPAELETLDERVRSRLAGGLLVEIAAPDLALRRRIAEARLKVVQRDVAQVELSDEVLDFIAENIVSNGRDLDGAVTRLVMHGKFEAITVDVAESKLRDLIRVRDARRVKIEDIQRAVCKLYNVSKADLLSARRTRVVVRPRQIAMYLSKVLTPRSLPEIGRRFGNRDHTTVLHAVRKIEDMVKSDRAVADEIETVRRQLDL